MEARRPYTNFDFLGGRAAARKVRRLRRLVSLGLVLVVVIGIATRAGLSLYNTSLVNRDTADLRTQERIVLNQINARLESGATKEQMVADLETRRELVTAAFGSDVAAASFMARLAPLGSDRVTLVGVSLSSNDAGNGTSGSGLAPKAQVQIEARLVSQEDVADWVEELERYFPEVTWGFPKWGDADADGSIKVSLAGPIAAVDPARLQEILDSLRVPGGAR